MAEEPTWTEDEVKRVAEFINYVHVNAEFPNCSKPAESRKLTKMFNDMAAHLKKIEGYIMELKAVYQAQKDKDK